MKHGDEEERESSQATRTQRPSSPRTSVSSGGWLLTPEGTPLARAGERWISHCFSAKKKKYLRRQFGLYKYLTLHVVDGLPLMAQLVKNLPAMQETAV